MADKWEYAVRGNYIELVNYQGILLYRRAICYCLPLSLLYPGSHAPPN